MNGPHATINRKRHVCIVLKVTGRNEHGQPRTFEALYPDESTSTEGRPEFLTAWVVKAAVEKRTS